MKKFVYNGEAYLSEQDLRNAIFNNERKAFGKVPVENEADFWAKHDVTFVEEQEPIGTYRHRKSLEIKFAFLTWRNNTATLFSSLGFKVDSNERANADVNGLLVAYEDNKDTLITFRDASNQFHSLTYAQVKVLQKEIIANGNFAYEQKWTLDSQVENATTKEELDAIKVEFVGKNFTKE